MLLPWQPKGKTFKSSFQKLLAQFENNLAHMVYLGGTMFQTIIWRGKFSCRMTIMCHHKT